MDSQLIGQRQNSEVRGCIESVLVLCYAGRKFDSTRVDRLVKVALCHPRLKHLPYKELYQITRHSFLVMDMVDFDEDLHALAALLPTQEACFTAMYVAVSVAVTEGAMPLNTLRRLHELQLFMGLTDEEMEEIMNQYQ